MSILKIKDYIQSASHQFIPLTDIRIEDEEEEMITEVKRIIDGRVFKIGIGEEIKLCFSSIIEEDKTVHFSLHIGYFHYDCIHVTVYESYQLADSSGTTADRSAKIEINDLEKVMAEFYESVKERNISELD